MWVAGFVRDLMWPASPLVREVLVMVGTCFGFREREQRGAGHSGPICVVIRVHGHQRVVFLEVLAARTSFIDRASVLRAARYHVGK